MTHNTTEKAAQESVGTSPSPGHDTQASALALVRASLDAAIATLSATAKRRVQTLANADAARARSLEEAQTIRAEAVARAERHAADLRAQIEDRFAAKSSKATNDRARAIERARNDLGSRVAAAKKEKSEASWLAETVCEAAVSKARADHDRLRHRVGEINQDVSLLDAALIQTLGPANAAKLAELPAPPTPAIETASIDLLKAAKDAAANAVADVGGGGVLKLLRSRASTLDLATDARAKMATVRAVGDKLIELSEAHRDSLVGSAKRVRDKEIAQVSAAAAQVVAECERELSAIIQGADSVFRAKQSEITAKRDDEVAKVAAWETEQRQMIERSYEQAATAAEDEHTLTTSVIIANANQEESLARVALRARMEEAREALHATSEAAMQASPPWSDEAWESREHPSHVPSVLPIGQLRLDLSSRISLLDDVSVREAELIPVLDEPLAMSLPGRQSLLLQHDAAGRADALTLLRSLMLRIFGAFPPGKVRFTMADPVALGQSFAGFMRLSEIEPSPVGQKIWSDPAQIERQLSDLTEHMQTVIQKYLRTDFATIEDYNVAAGEIAEPYRFIIIADMHVALTEAGAAKLASIIDAGPRCGVYAILAGELGKKLPPTLPLTALKSKLLQLSTRDGAITIADNRFDECVLMLDRPPDDATAAKLLDQVGAAGRNAGRVEVAFDRLVPSDAEMWTRSCATELAIPLGRSGAQKIQHLKLGLGTRQHALIAGRTGSGKSTLLHVMISAAALWHAPDELEFYLIDFKKGVEFKAYCDGTMPHVRAVAIESDREFGLSVLRRLDEELIKRGDLFRKLRAQDLASARRLDPAARLPRVLLLIDEFQEFFVVDDEVASESALLLDRLVRQGRAFGVHVVLGSQTLAGAYSLARSTLGQMGVRIALQCSEADAHLILGDDNDGARLLNRPGEAIYNDAGGLSEGNSPFQTAWLNDSVRDAQLRRMAERAPSELPPPVVFEGNAPARLDVSLAALVQAAPDASIPRAVVGDAVSIAPPVAAVLRKRAGTNVLMVGSQAEPAMGILAAMCTSLSRTPTARIIVIDPTLEDDSMHGRISRALSECGVNATVERAASAAAVVRSCDETVSARHADAGGVPTFLVLAGLHRLRELRKSEDFGFSLDDDKDSPYARLERVLRDGPAVGVWTIAWCDTLATLERSMARGAIREFGQRVLMQMNASDSAALMDSSAASHLGANRVLLADADAGTAVKARPIELADLPTAKRVSAILHR